jgi:pyruvate formate lyase activating enzyme
LLSFLPQRRPGGPCSCGAVPTEAEIFAYLEKRRGLLDGVVVSGGEPLLQEDLQPFLQKIKDLGYLVKLDTNGSFPGALEKILAAKLVDYVAMDIKQAPDKYNLAIGHYYASGASANPTAVRNATNSGSLSPVPRIKLSLELLRKSGVPFELRTTLVQGIHSEADLEALARWIAGPQPYFLQSYVDSGDVIDNRNLAAFPPETLAAVLNHRQKILSPGGTPGCAVKLPAGLTEVPARERYRPGCSGFRKKVIHSTAARAVLFLCTGVSGRSLQASPF